ncbi:alpha/beta fold hydrolase [Staphylococcus caprae]|uniref:alpha/beta fold hydrolase n=1 Tax=Staphylococcus caprae TaxID=29380 RepID=UPI003B21EE8E
MEKILTCNQIELAYNDEGQGIPIILIHGLDGNLSGFQDLKNELLQSHRVITYDVRGHGKSSRSESYDLKDHVEDLRYLMDALNVSSAHILGHDMGGIIGREFTETYQHKVISLTIVSAKREDITHGFTKLMVDNQEEVAGFNKSEAMIILFPKLFNNQDKAMRWYQRQKLYSRPTPEDSAIAIRALLNSVDVTKDVHNKVTVPTFIVNGEHDPLIFDKQHYRIDNYFENVRKSIFSDSGHAPHIEEPERFLEQYLDFIQKVEDDLE